MAAGQNRDGASLNMLDSLISIPAMPGNGGYRIDVAGESFYEESFSSLCGERTITGARIEVRARLELEDNNPHDKHAVRVMIQGLQVGHLSRDDARAFRRLVRYGSLAEHEIFECSAVICGGWDRGDGDKGNFGVRLDLNLSDE
jgi:hypothetical protein